MYMSWKWKMKQKAKSWWYKWNIAVTLFVTMFGFAIFASLDAIVANWL